jgi:hypothetical protein
VRLARLGQPGDQGGRQLAVAHIVEGQVIQHEVGMAGTQQVEKV